MYTRAQVEAGQGRYTDRGTVIIQRGNHDVFDTHPQESGWAINQKSEWHVAGHTVPFGAVVWVVSQFELFSASAAVRLARTLLLGQTNDLFNGPQVVGDAGLQGGRHPQRLVAAHEVVVHEVQRDSVF